MPTEAGDQKLVGNFRILIDQVSGEPDYNPANPSLAKAALETQYTAGLTAANNVPLALAPNKLAITVRLEGFTEARPKFVRANNALQSSGASKGEIADAKTPLRKLTGGRATPKIKDDPATPQDESKASKSASQMSYDNQLGNAAAFLAILSNIAAYKPNEPELKIAALQATLADLQAKNNAVSSTAVTLSQARGVRDQLLYLSEDSIVAVALLVKTYVRAAFGADHQLYKQIKGLEFTKAGK